MGAHTFESILKDIRNKVLYPVYFLMGEESFYIDVIADFLEEQVLTEQEKEFNLSVVYGRDTDVHSVISLARRYPMMASHHLVIVREAQGLEDVESLEGYTEQPLASTVLVICYKYKTLDRRKKFVKDLAKKGVVFEAKKLYENQVPAWISDYISRKGFRANPYAIQMLADHLGNDLGKIVNELGKAFMGLRKGEEITTQLIEEHIGISKDFNVFELQHALGTKDAVKAHQIARYFADNPRQHPLVMTLGLLYQYFAKLLVFHSLRDKSRKNVAAALSVNPFFVAGYQRAAGHFTPAQIIGIFSLLRDTDVRSKGVGNVSVTNGELLKELVYKILHA